jgi:PAS domain S-box-containing protein
MECPVPKPFIASNSNVPTSSMLPARRASGLFMWVISTDILYADSSVAQSFGFDPADAASGLSIERYLSCIHPEDLAVVSHAIRDAILTGDPYQEEYRVCRPDGSIQKVAAFGSCFRDGGDEASHFAGIIVPVTEDVQSDENLLDLFLQAHDVARRAGKVDITAKIFDIVRQLVEDSDPQNLDIRSQCKSG